MRIGIRLHDVVADNFEDMVATAAKQGMKCCQLALSKAVREFPTGKEAMTPGLAMYMKSVFDKYGVDVAVLGCYLNLANPNKEQLADTIDTYRRHIVFAAAIGAGVVGTETGACNEEYKSEPYSFTEEALEKFIAGLKPVVEIAEKLGVLIAIEPVAKHIVNNAVRARKVLDTINSPNLQIIFDPVNLLDGSNYTDRDAIFDEFIQLLGPDIVVLHAKDFVVKDGQIISVAAGTGMMDYTKIVSYMKQHKPMIHVSLEDTVPENAEAARIFLQEMYDKA